MDTTFPNSYHSSRRSLSSLHVYTFGKLHSLQGNHSAGKSSFINWYVEEHIQRTGVAIETQGFTFITSGRKRESLTGRTAYVSLLIAETTVWSSFLCFYL